MVSATLYILAQQSSRMIWDRFDACDEALRSAADQTEGLGATRTTGILILVAASRKVLIEGQIVFVGGAYVQPGQNLSQIRLGHAPDCFSAGLPRLHGCPRHQKLLR